ncbi:BrxA family protein [Yersinia enterocolitica]
MNIKEYIGDLVGGSLFLTESRIIAESLLKDLSDDKWKSLIIENNILQKKSGQTAIRYARTIRCRIEGLGKVRISRSFLPKLTR